jgi:hypothetical protein
VPTIDLYAHGVDLFEARQRFPGLCAGCTSLEASIGIQGIVDSVGPGLMRLSGDGLVDLP